MQYILKYIFIPVLMIALTHGSALAGRWYIGASLAAAKTDNDDDQLNRQLADSGLNATAETQDDIRMPRQLYVGFGFTDQWGIELAYLDLDKVETTFTGTTVDIEAFLNSAQYIHPQTAQGLLYSVVYYLPVDYTTRVKFRLGMYDWSADYTLQATTASKVVSQGGSDMSYSVSMELGDWHSEGVVGHIKMEQYTIDQKDLKVVAFGFSYFFE